MYISDIIRLVSIQWFFMAITGLAILLFFKLIIMFICDRLFWRESDSKIQDIDNTDEDDSSSKD